MTTPQLLLASESPEKELHSLPEGRRETPNSNPGEGPSLLGRLYDFLDCYHRLPDISPCALLRSSLLSAAVGVHPEHVQRGLDAAKSRGFREMEDVLAQALQDMTRGRECH